MPRNSIKRSGTMSTKPKQEEDQRAFVNPYPTPPYSVLDLCPIPISYGSKAAANPTLASTGPRVVASALPVPTYIPPNPKKKTHARKQPLGHVPRPRNAFILFRCDFVRQKKIPEDVENDHRNISRIVGRIWREMSDEDKLPWVEMAEREKLVHSQTYPGYKYTPAQSQASPPAAGGSSSSRSTTPSSSRVGREVCAGAGDNGAGSIAASSSIAARRKWDRKEKFYSKKKSPVDEVQDLAALDQPSTRRPVDEFQNWPPIPVLPPAALSTLDYSSHFDPSFQMAQVRRPSSCPPPDSTPVSMLREESLPTPLVTRDDLARRPSRVVMYQSNSPVRFSFPQNQEPTSAYGYTTHYPPQQAYSFPWARGLHLNPSISIGAYQALPDTYGWDSTPSRDPQLWANWDGLPLRQMPASNSTLPLVSFFVLPRLANPPLHPIFPFSLDPLTLNTPTPPFRITRQPF